jgi:gamma-glutamyltranspeptidase / glutathione hydrolase
MLITDASIVARIRFGLAVLALSVAQVAQAADRPAVRAPHGMVASSSMLASHVGAEILRAGGNAVDAAVATALALAVTHPSAGNLGGGGFMVIRMADGRSEAIDYRETAPAAASRTMYLDDHGEVVRDASTVGYRAVGVPGTVAGLALAIKRFGTLPWAKVVEPARVLAAEGFPIGRDLAQQLASQESRFKPFPETWRIFNRSGHPFTPGETFRQPELATTLGRIESQGPSEFYEGKTAQLIVADMQAHKGLITLDDLRTYHPAERQLLRGTYRGYEVLTMPPPSSGGATLLQMLNVLEGFDLRSLGLGSSAADDLVVEAMRRAFADRAVFFGDPDFGAVPVGALTSKSYAAKQRATIDPAHATPSASIDLHRPSPTESNHTTHFSVVDAAGNAVSNTFTLNLGFGSAATVTGAGFLLNNEMDDFTAKPGVPNAFGLIQGEANAIAPRKRPLSSMTPTIVLKDGRLAMVLGSPGGPTIINSVLEVLVGVIDFGLEPQAAVDYPRFHHQWMPDLVFYEPNGLSPDTQAALAAKGQHLAPTSEFMKKSPYPYLGDVEMVVIDPGSGDRLGASDPRWGDSGSEGY